MAYFNNRLPSCCSVGMMAGFPYDFVGNDPVLPRPTSSSGTFVAIFNRYQKQSYDKLCRENTLLSVATSPGEMGPRGPKRLAICVFQRGKRK